MDLFALNLTGYHPTPNTVDEYMHLMPIFYYLFVYFYANMLLNSLPSCSISDALPALISLPLPRTTQ